MLLKHVQIVTTPILFIKRKIAAMSTGYGHDKMQRLHSLLLVPIEILRLQLPAYNINEPHLMERSVHGLRLEFIDLNLQHQNKGKIIHSLEQITTNFSKGKAFGLYNLTHLKWISMGENILMHPYRK